MRCSFQKGADIVRLSSIKRRLAVETKHGRLARTGGLGGVSLTLSSAFNHCIALNSLLCADVPLRTYTLTHSLAGKLYFAHAVANTSKNRFTCRRLNPIKRHILVASGSCMLRLRCLNKNDSYQSRPAFFSFLSKL